MTGINKRFEIFYKLEMEKTVQQNGVLIYIAHEDRRFAILGDKGINHVVPANFWDGTKEVMAEHFKREEFLQGVVFAIQEVGSHLKQYFPFARGWQAELYFASGKDRHCRKARDSRDCCRLSWKKFR